MASSKCGSKWPAKSARIVVRDTGQGISPEFLPYVFDRFRQNDSSSARRHGGLGLGLVRDLVAVHGVCYRQRPEPGRNQGATFTIELPLIASAEVGGDPGRHRLGETSAPVLTGVRVLVVDDEPDARDLAVTALRQCGAHVNAVTSSSDAISVLLAALPDSLPHVIVADIGMPKEDGYDLIRKVRSLQPEQGGRIPAVTLTGYATPVDVKRALAAGYELHVAKPMDPQRARVRGCQAGRHRASARKPLKRA